MNVTTAYMYTVKNLPQMFQAIQRAQVPPRFTHEFLKTLGFKGSNDRAFINVLKGLGFLDSTSVPTASYREYKDSAVAKAILARQIRTAYEGVFLADENANGLTAEAVKGKLSTISGKDQSVVKKMATTFKALCELGDFSAKVEIKGGERNDELAEDLIESPALAAIMPQVKGLAFSHVVYINLPTTRDPAVYDAIFKSIRDHLL